MNACLAHGGCEIKSSYSSSLETENIHIQMESFTHVLIQPDVSWDPLPQPCIQLFKLLHPLPNQNTFHLQNPRHASSTSIFQLTCPFVANITSSDPCVSAASGMLLLWLNPIIFPIRLGSACGQGLCLSIGLTSRHQPLGRGEPFRHDLHA